MYFVFLYLCTGPLLGRTYRPAVVLRRARLSVHARAHLPSGRFYYCTAMVLSGFFAPAVMIIIIGARDGRAVHDGRAAHAARADW